MKIEPCPATGSSIAFSNPSSNRWPTCQALDKRCVRKVWLRHTRTAPSALAASRLAAYTAFRCHMLTTLQGLAAAAAPGAAPVHACEHVRAYGHRGDQGCVAGA